jgi:hypothetical protein
MWLTSEDFLRWKRFKGKLRIEGAWDMREDFRRRKMPNDEEREWEREGGWVFGEDDCRLRRNIRTAAVMETTTRIPRLTPTAIPIILLVLELGEEAGLEDGLVDGLVGDVMGTMVEPRPSGKTAWEMEKFARS